MRNAAVAGGLAASASATAAFRILRAWNNAATCGERLRHPQAFKDTLKGEIEQGLRYTGADIAHAEATHSQIWRRFQAFLEKYEYFVLPAVRREHTLSD